MDKLKEKEKNWVVADLPDSCTQNMIYTLYSDTPFISIVILTTKTQIYITEKCF